MDPRVFSIFLIFSWAFMGQHPGRELYDACWYGDFDGAYDALEVPNPVFWLLGIQAMCSMYLSYMALSENVGLIFPMK